MGVEIERKFLVDHDKWRQLDKPKGLTIRQGYMVKEPSKTIRVRIRDEQAYITIKGKSTGISHSEYEYEIPLGDGLQLLHEFCDAVIHKERYCITYAANVWEIDVFEGDNEGLIMAEIELKDAEQLFDLPDWAIKEVSDDKRYYNSNLSVNPYKSWHKKAMSFRPHRFFKNIFLV